MLPSVSFESRLTVDFLIQKLRPIPYFIIVINISVFPYLPTCEHGFLQYVWGQVFFTSYIMTKSLPIFKKASLPDHPPFMYTVLSGTLHPLRRAQKTNSETSQSLKKVVQGNVTDYCFSYARISLFRIRLIVAFLLTHYDCIKLCWRFHNKKSTIKSLHC